MRFWENWRNTVRTRVIQHVPSKAQAVLEWILAVEAKDATFESLSDSGDFPELDVELAAAVVHIVHGELGRRRGARRLQGARLGDSIAAPIAEERAAPGGRMGPQFLFGSSPAPPVRFAFLFYDDILLVFSKLQGFSRS